jgi:hypothetical protein
MIKYFILAGFAVNFVCYFYRGIRAIHLKEDVAPKPHSPLIDLGDGLIMAISCLWLYFYSGLFN